MAFWITAVLLLGAGATETGLLVAAQMAPSIVAGLFIGVWVDRLPRPARGAALPRRVGRTLPDGEKESECVFAARSLSYSES